MARVVVDVMLKPEILDPQGQAVANALPRLGVAEVASVRVGRRIELEFDGDPDLAKVAQLADRLLANPVIEDYTVTVDGELVRLLPAGRPEPPIPEPAAASPAAEPDPGPTPDHDPGSWPEPVPPAVPATEPAGVATGPDAEPELAAEPVEAGAPTVPPIAETAQGREPAGGGQAP